MLEISNIYPIYCKQATECTQLLVLIFALLFKRKCSGFFSFLCILNVPKKQFNLLTLFSLKEPISQDACCLLISF